MNHLDAMRIIASNRRHIERLTAEKNRSFSDPLVLKYSQEMDEAVLYLQRQAASKWQAQRNA